MERACTKCGKAIGEKDTRVEFSVQKTIFIVFDESVRMQDGIDDKCGISGTLFQRCLTLAVDGGRSHFLKRSLCVPVRSSRSESLSTV